VRLGYLARHPLCADPFGVHGVRVVAATEVDHIVPHKGDMTLFWNAANWQGLCKDCHSRKTATEDGGFGR
jgi:5-methylcytosine-specific restriction protein A